MAAKTDITRFRASAWRTSKQWARWENVGLSPTLDLSDLVLNWTSGGVIDLGVYGTFQTPRGEQHAGAITGIELERTIEGASTLTITLRDPDHQLFSTWAKRTQPKALTKAQRRLPVDVDEGWEPIVGPNLIGKAMEVQLNGAAFRLVSVSYQHQTQEITLTFEDRIVYLLRRKGGSKTKPGNERRASRAKVTRAQFILSLVREIKTFRPPFICPELTVPQPIDKPAKTDSTGTAKTKAGQTGDVPGYLDKIYPRHRIGTSGAARLSERQVRAAAELAGLSPTDALHAAQIAHGESDYYPGVVQDDPGDGNVGHGLWQMTPHAWGPPGNATARHMESLGGLDAMRNPIQAARQMKWMHDQAKGWSPWYGTRYLNLGAKAQGSVLKDGVETDSAGGPEADAASKGASSKSYQFTRAKDEDSWTAIQRLASEVKWRFFVVGEAIYYMSETQLYGRRPRYEITAQHPALIDLQYNVDWAKTVSEASMTVALDRWAAPPGAVMLLSGFGPPDGRWLITQIRRDWFQPVAEVTIKQPGKAALEPASEQATRSAAAATTGRGGPSSGKVTGVWPGKFPVTGAYGTQRPGHIHGGLDVGVPSGTDCIAPFDGTITHVSSSGFGVAGGMVHLRADRSVAGLKQGDKIGWGHCTSPRVKTGEKVTAGKVVAKSNGSPPHVHFVLLREGQGGNSIDGNADPSQFLRKVGSI